MPLPVAFDLVQVRGHYVDLTGAAVVGRLEFTPSIVSMTLEGPKIVVIGRTIGVELVNGQCSVNLPATDDPDVRPKGFTYRVSEVFVGVPGRTWDLQVPLAAQAFGMDLALEGPTPETGDRIQLLGFDGGTPSSTFAARVDGGSP